MQIIFPPGSQSSQTRCDLCGLDEKYPLSSCGATALRLSSALSNPLPKLLPTSRTQRSPRTQDTLPTTLTLSPTALTPSPLPPAALAVPTGAPKPSPAPWGRAGAGGAALLWGDSAPPLARRLPAGAASPVAAASLSSAAAGRGEGNRAAPNRRAWGKLREKGAGVPRWGCPVGFCGRPVGSGLRASLRGWGVWVAEGRRGLWLGAGVEKGNLVPVCWDLLVAVGGE